jgi:hypothetical protein
LAGADIEIGVNEAPAVWMLDAFEPAQNVYLDYHRKQVLIF